MEDAMAWLTNPLAVVDAMVTSGEQVDVEAWFAERIEAHFQQIPSLNDTPVEMIPPNSLVRYRCMVQDTFNPEYYIDSFASQSADGVILRTGRYRDAVDAADDASFNMHDPNTAIRGRCPLYCVPVPGEADWARAQFAAQSAQPEVAAGESTGRSKRGYQPEEDAEQGAVPADRGEEAAARDAAASTPAATESQPLGAATNLKKSRSGPSVVELRAAASGFDLNMPLGAVAQAPPVIVKMYGEEHGIKVMDAVEFVGVYTLDASDPAQHATDEQGSGFRPPAAEIRAHCPPASLVPRLHCITHNVRDHVNPILPINLNDEVFASACASAGDARAALVGLLTSTLGGDELAAEYVLLHLFSHVYTRMEDGLLLGKLSLNLFGVSQDRQSVIESVSTAISELVPAAHLFHMSLAQMNSVRMIPVKDNEADRIQAGALQLVAGTHLVLDETALEQGQLQDRGVKNVLALQDLIKKQVVSFEFEHTPPIEFGTDVPVLVFSEGKSMFPVDVSLPLAPEFPFEVPAVAEEVVAAVRGYIGALKLASFSISQEMQAAVEQDFVAMRQADKNVKGETLHELLVLARLISLSRGELELSEAAFLHAKEMESLRLARLA